MRIKCVNQLCLSLVLLFLLIFPAYGWNKTVYTSVISINPVVQWEEGEYAKYLITIYNPSNFSYYVEVYTLSPSWIFKITPNYFVLKPKETKNIYVSLFPVSQDVKTAAIVGILYRNESYEGEQVLTLTPSIYFSRSEKITVTKPKKTLLYLNIVCLNTTAVQGSKIYFKVNVINFNTNPVNLTLRIHSDALSNVYVATIKVDSFSNKTFTIFTRVSEIILPGKYLVTVNAKANGYSKTFSFYIDVLEKKKRVKVVKTKSGYILENLENTTATATLRVKVNFFDELVYNYEPEPTGVLIQNKSVYYIWNLILLPNEKIKIVRKLNLLNVFVISMLLVLIVVNIIFFLAVPRVVVRKEIISMDTEKKKIKVMVSIENRSLFKLRDVKIVEKVPSLFSFVGCEFVDKPMKAKIREGVELRWIIDEIDPKEERILTYTLSYEAEIIGEIVLEPTVIEFELFRRKWKVKSNRIILRFVK